MTTLSLSRSAFSDIERFTDFLIEHESESAARTFEVIINALEALRQHPYIGRAIEGGLRELIISRGRTGYVALYEFDRVRDEVVIHRVRHQLEAGYSPE